jgi:hypothetical protein
MFVQIAEDVKMDEAAKTLCLVKVSRQTLYFSDRPVRIAGHLKMADYLKEWTSKAGEDNRLDVNQMLIQPFVNYNPGKGLAIGSAPIITANWEASSGQKWTVPLGAQISQIIPIGKIPVNFLLGAYYYVEKPDNGPDWSLRFQFALLFPKKEK